MPQRPRGDHAALTPRLPPLTPQADACSDGADAAAAKAREALSLYREAVPLASDVHQEAWPMIKLRLDEVRTLTLLHGADTAQERAVRVIVHGLRRGCEVQPADYFDPLTHGLYELGGSLRRGGHEPRGRPRLAVPERGLPSDHHRRAVL